MSNDIRDTMAGNLKTIRRLLGGLSQEKFGEMFGMKRTNIDSYESKRADLPNDKTLELSKFLGCTVNDLWTKDFKYAYTPQSFNNMVANASISKLSKNKGK